MSHKRTTTRARGRAKVLAEKKVAGKRSEVLLALKNSNTQLQQAFLNVKNMYDQKVMEAASLQQQITLKDRLLTSLCVEGPVTVSAADLEVVNSGQFIGFDLDLDEETQDITITVVAAEANSVVVETDEEENADDSSTGD